MIKKLVADLPEVYQPIYAHPELSEDVSRLCLDRLGKITTTYTALQSFIGRPLKVLDLGCAQGFFSLNLAEHGAIVHGVDFLDKNVALCNALVLENPALQVSFEESRIEDIVSSLQTGQYDLVLGLSVFHHIVYEKGVGAVKGLLNSIAEKCGALILELALRDEPLYWGSAQPERPKELLEGISFVRTVAHYNTHLANIPRPLFVASNRYWIFEDHTAQFDNFSFDSHALAHGTYEKSRRYFFSSEFILKSYSIAHHPLAKKNEEEFTKEVSFLQQPPPDFAAPSLVAFGKNEMEAWIVMQRLPGRLLLDLLHEGDDLDSYSLLLSVLRQLTILEAAGLYHNDVRAWNVLFTGSGVLHLIDYGAISADKEDCAWPGNLFLSFLVFVREVSTGVIDDPNPLRTISISPYGLPQPYSDWAKSLWERPLSEWSFQSMYQTLLEFSANERSESLEKPMDAWMKAIEDGLQKQKVFTQNFAFHSSSRIEEAVNITKQAESRAIEAESKAIEADTKANVTAALASEAETRVNTQFASIQVLKNSNSWKVTAPLRFAGRTLRSVKIGSALRNVKLLLQHSALYIARRPRLKRFVLAVLKKFPKVKNRLAMLRHQQATILSFDDHVVPDELAQLSPHARRIYLELKNTIEKFTEGGH